MTDPTDSIIIPITRNIGVSIGAGPTPTPVLTNGGVGKRFLKLLVAGAPKSAGKTTFGLSLPSNNKLVLSYDLGGVFAPPGVDPASIWEIEYPPADPKIHNFAMDPKTKQQVELFDGRWGRPINVADRIFRDAEEIRDAFRQGRPIKIGEQEIPLPDLLLLSGVTEFKNIALDYVLGVNKVSDPTDFENRYMAWTMRSDKMRALFNMLIPLPCHVVIECWENDEIKNNVPTSRILPDIGGGLDYSIAGKMSAAVRCYYEANKWWVQVKSDNIRQWIGVRGKYDVVEKIDVTINPKNPVSPFERALGYMLGEGEVRQVMRRI